MNATVASLHVYPVKGFKGIDLREATATERGLEHDRRWMVVDPAGEILHPAQPPQARDHLDGHPRRRARALGSRRGFGTVPFEPPPAPSDARARLEPRGRRGPGLARGDFFLSSYLGTPCRLVYMPDTRGRTSNPVYAGDANRLVGFADGYAIPRSQPGLPRRPERAPWPSRAIPPPDDRFRPNIVVAGAAPYAEDAWRELRLGEAILRAAKPCGRCEVTTTDQATGEVLGPEPLATLGTYRNSDEFGVMFGLNLVCLRTGKLRVGDAIETERIPA
jgi:uncharacterized protein YcbX